MFLSELLDFLTSDTESGRIKILEAVSVRLGIHDGNQAQNPTDRVRMMTIHGSKGLQGNVVFIPGLEEGILPHSGTLPYPGLINEERRLLYTAITRAQVSCIISLAQTSVVSLM